MQVLHEMSPEQLCEIDLNNELNFRSTYQIPASKMHLYNVSSFDEFDVNDDVEFYEI